jgi:hypothetical protein
MWLKNKCATLITRIARGAIARLGARLERARLQRLEKDRFASEQHAVEVAMDVARKEIVLYLAAGKVRATPDPRPRVKNGPCGLMYSHTLGGSEHTHSAKWSRGHGNPHASL